MQIRQRREALLPLFWARPACYGRAGTCKTGAAASRRRLARSFGRAHGHGARAGGPGQV